MVSQRGTGIQGQKARKVCPAKEVIEEQKVSSAKKEIQEIWGQRETPAFPEETVVTAITGIEVSKALLAKR